MSQNLFSQQSMELPDISLPDNFFSNFDEITNKYKNIELNNNNKNIDEEYKKDYPTFLNGINNNINFHSFNKIENPELIFDSPKAKKVSKFEKNRMNNFDSNLDNEKEIIFNEFLNSNAYYNNKKNKYYYDKLEIEKNDRIIKPNLKEILSPKSWDDDVVFINENLFNNKGFKAIQKEIINSVLMNKDIYAFIPSELEKSICYEIPSIVLNDSVTLIVLSSISLINKKIESLENLGIKVLNLESDTIKNINIEKILNNENLEESIKILFITPEIIKKKEIMDLLIKLYENRKLKRIIIDEINYMSEWDKNYRQDYSELKNIKENFKNIGILLFSNNPSKIIRDDVIHILNLKNVLYFNKSYNKPNLFFEVRNKKNKIDEVIDDIMNIIKKNYNNESGIIYCNSKEESEIIYKIMKNNYNINISFCHEELADDQIKDINNKWIKDEIKVMITNINSLFHKKPNIRFAIHYDIPKNIKIYYEQIEIVGKDGEPSKCILYYNNSETNKRKSLICNEIKNKENEKEELRELSKIINYCEEESECRRVLLLSYFNEDFKKERCHHMCDNCNKNKYYNNFDCTKECKIILSLLYNNKNRNYYAEQIIDILKGINNENYEKMINRSEYFGKLSLFNKDEINKMINLLIIKEYIDEYITNDNSTIHSILEINNLGEKFYKSNDIIINIALNRKFNNGMNLNSNYHRNYNINIYHENKKILGNEYKIENTEDYGLCEPCEFYDLLEQLKNIRREMLKKENDKRKNSSKDGDFIPLKLDDIISDISLKEIVRNLPTKLEDLSKENILDKYADKILSIIIKFINIYDIDINKRKENREINLYYGDKNDLKYIIQ